MDFDSHRLYYSHQQLHNTNNNGNNNNNTTANNNNDHNNVDEQHQSQLPTDSMRRHFREFFRNYRTGSGNNNNNTSSYQYPYRNSLLKMHRKNRTCVQVELAHVGEYDPSLLGYVLNHPITTLPILEQAAYDALQTLRYDMLLLNTQNTNTNTNNTSNNNNNDNNNNPTTMTTQDDDNDFNLLGNNNNDAQQQQQQTTTNDNNSNTTTTTSNIQILLLASRMKMTPLRQIQSQHMNVLLHVPGIVISCSPIKNRATKLVVRCSKCSTGGSTAGGGNQPDTQTILADNGPFSSILFPTQCPNENCPKYSYVAIPDESTFVDQQTMKLQESPERVPTGEMPRNVLCVVERNFVDTAPPGTRVSILCIPTLFTSAASNNNNNNSKSVYLRVVGMVKDNHDGQHAGKNSSLTFAPQEEEAFQTLSKHPDLYDILSRSMAPDIRGNYTVDIKKALICQLFGGTRKHLSDGIRLRGDINVLLLGDPSMAKSQFLKFVSKVAPIGIYTSGKGSSAAGLTASVVKNANNEFYLEGGAMVLADGGIVCIDEFDKMRSQDRVAIHEAMEQQTISVAKAGITTVLNSRSSVLAAANPVFGRYDDFKSASDNIDLMTTILSRFDMIFLVRDIREEERDRLICQHVMGVHIEHSSNNSSNGNNNNSGGGGGGDGWSSSRPEEMDETNAAGNSPEAIAENIMKVVSTGQGELDVAAMKKYIQYCKAKCTPVLSEEAGEVLTSHYVKIRDDVRKQAIASSGQSSGNDHDTQAVIPITVRQLEALVRISESLAKMRMDKIVRSEDVTEALRLFRVSTMAASAADQTSGGNNTGSYANGGNNLQEMERTESFLHSRLTKGSVVNRQKLIEEAAGQGYNAIMVARALSVMTGRGELLERNQGRLLKRIK